MMEKMGISSAVLCTEPFLEQGRAMASVHGFQDYAMVRVFHPIATASKEALMAEAEQIIGDVERLLTGMPGEQ